MKKHIITALALAAVVGVGAGVGAIALRGEAKEASAGTGASKKLLLDVSATNWASKGANIYVHYWGGSSASTWPGVALENNGFGYYTAQVPDNTTGLKFHVGENWGGDCETGDLTFNESNMLWTITSQASPCTASASAVYAESTVYVLDKGHNRLQVNHYAHIYGGSHTTSWPGIPMDTVTGYSIYSATYPAENTTANFHNNEGNQTDNITLVPGKVGVLESDWSISKWISLEAAQYIDKYLMFGSVSEDDGTKGTACLTYYGNAKNAYDGLSEAAQKEVVTVNGVVERLTQWALANGKTFTVKDEVGVFGANTYSVRFEKTESDNTGIYIVAGVSVATVVAAAGIALFLKRRKQD